MIAFIGQAPSRDTDGKLPFSGRSGKKLAALMGMSHEEFGRRFVFMNVLDYFPGKNGKGDAFPMAEAKAKASQMDLSGYELVILVGKRVAEAFEIRNVPMFRLLEVRQSVGLLGAGRQFRAVFRDVDKPHDAITVLGETDKRHSFLLEEVFKGAVIPHPSGVNRWWNDPLNENEAREFLRSLVNDRDS